jgi:UDP-N-acetylmuramyl pentapeptide phosphotransferase/UDP-N-acetylglucosamine-1-phosphate transferase
MTYPAWLPAALALGACIAAYLLTGAVVTWLRRKQILDRPNPRSSHSRPTPRGGGWGIVGIVLPAWAGLAWWSDRLHPLAPMLAAASLLVAVCWADDRGGVHPLLRLAVQSVSATAGLLTFGSDQLIFQGWLPLPLDRAAAALCWVWFMNLYNFMDGIDGLAAAETIAVGVGIMAVAVLTGLFQLSLHAAALLGAAAGFLVWNWQPARVFMGDVGSVPLGFLVGWLLLVLASAGLWQAAILLPLYFLADATFTLLRRLARGAPVWRPHREHLYQQAVEAGRTHAAVTSAVLGINAVLIALAVSSLTIGWPALLAGAGAISLFLLWLARRE